MDKYLYKVMLGKFEYHALAKSKDVAVKLALAQVEKQGGSAVSSAIKTVTVTWLENEWDMLYDSDTV